MNDMTYQVERNALIPIAERRANRTACLRIKKIKTKEDQEEYEAQCAKWNQVFHAAMKRLAKENGL